MGEDRTGTARLRHLRRGARHLLGSSVLLAMLGLAVWLLPAPVVDRLLESELRSDAVAHQARLLDELAAGARTFTTGALAASDQDFLTSLMRATDYRRLSLLDREGRIFWSSQRALVGERHEEAHFLAAVAAGEVHYRTVAIAPADHARHGLGDRPGTDRGDRLVAEIDVPVLLDGRVVGGVEVAQDITGLRAAFVARVRAVLLAVSAVAVAALALVSWVLWRAGRTEMAAAAARAEAERRILAEQLRLSREVRLLGELNEWLQSSRSLPELFSMVARFMAHLLPGLPGSLYVYSSSRDVLDGAVSWSGATHDDHIRPEDCWGLRRGRAYSFGDSEVDFACGHMHDDPGRRAVCLPILAHGETVGLMTLTAPEGTPPDAFAESRRLAQMSAEQISLAIANVRMRDALHHQAVRDPLTGLFNRRHLLETLRRLLGARDAGEVSLVSMDVDHFKRFNDNHGHDAGDMVLRAVGEALLRHADGDVIACRVGGEELMLLLPGHDAAAALDRAERVRQEVAALSVRYGDKTLPRITVSVGVAQHPRHGTMPQQLIRAADDALYLAKARGRNQVVLAGEETEAEGADAWALDRAEDDGASPPAPGAEAA